MKQKISLLFIMFILLTGCASNQKTIQSQDNSKSTVTLEQKETPTNTFAPTIGPITPERLTESPAATFAVSQTTEPTPTLLTPTWTPLPTISPLESGNFVTDLMVNNAGCELPCFWGITPGKTSWQAAEHLLQSFTQQITRFPDGAIDENNVTAGTFGVETHYSLPDNLGSLMIIYRVEDGTVKQIEVNSDHGTAVNYQLYQVFSEYGKPEEVLLFLLPNTPAGTPWYSIYVFYVKRGIILIYGGETKIIDDQIEVCSSGKGPDMMLIPPDSLTLYWMQRKAYDAPFRIPSVNDFPEMNVEIFYQKTKNPNTCLYFSLL